MKQISTGGDFEVADLGALIDGVLAEITAGTFVVFGTIAKGDLSNDAPLASADFIQVLHSTADINSINADFDALTAQPNNKIEVDLTQLGGRFQNGDLVLTGPGLPNGRSSWGTFGQLAQDAIQGLIFASTEGNFNLTNPSFLIIDQQAQAVFAYFYTSGDVDLGADITGTQTLRLVAAPESVASDWFE